MLTNSNELLGQALGTCTLKRLLGRGGMGAVYLAQQTRPRRIVAVKVLLPNIIEERPREEFLARFRREADAIAALDHIHIMPIYEYGEQGEIAFLVMPYVTGGTLRDHLEKHPRFALTEIVPIIEQAASGLDTAHAQGIIHRDLKPGNILFHADGRILLADFGLAKMLKEIADDTGHSVLTSTGTIIGTPEYLSPEQGTGDKLDARTDIYSLGVVLYQMLAGRVPFVGPSPVAIAIKHTIEAPPPIKKFNPNVQPAVEAVVMKALAKSPDQRFNSAGELARALRQAVAEVTTGTLNSAQIGPSTTETLNEHHQLPVTPATPQGPLVKLESSEPVPQAEVVNVSSAPQAPLVQDREEQVTKLPTLFLQTEKVDVKPGTEKQLPIGSEQAGIVLQAATATTGDASEEKKPDPVHVGPSRSAYAEEIVLPGDKTIADSSLGRQEEASTYITTPEQRSKPALSEPQKSDATSATTKPEPVHLYDQHAYPALPTRTNGKSLRLIIIGSFLAMIIVAGSLATYFMSHPQTTPNTGPTHNGSTTTQTSTGTPSQGATPQITQSQLPPLLPLSASPPVGPLVYGTTAPGTCDKSGGQWNKVNDATFNCTNNGTQITSSGTMAGTFLTTMPGKNMPDNGYVVQLEVDASQDTAGRFGIIFFSPSTNQYNNAFVLLITPGANPSWAIYHFNDQGELEQVTTYTVPLHGITMGQLKTIDLVARVDHTYDVYINGESQGNTESGPQFQTKGNIGLVVELGANVTFKNISLYGLAG